MYTLFKFLHVLGVVLLLGNVTASAVWKVFANRSRNPVVVGFSQRLVTYTDWSLTLGGVLLIIAGGYGMVLVSGLDLRQGWLLWGQLLFVVSGAIWVFKLIPIQTRQSRAARGFEAGTAVPGPAYWVLCRSWIVWGALATVPLVAATYVMLAKF